VIVVDVHIHYYHGNDEVDRVVVVAADMKMAAIVDNSDVKLFQYLLDYLVVIHLVQKVR
jgi:hypothetical protein